MHPTSKWNGMKRDETASTKGTTALCLVNSEHNVDCTQYIIHSPKRFGFHRQPSHTLWRAREGGGGGGGGCART